MPDAEIIATLRNKYQALRPVLDEKVRRRWAACEAMAIGWGGITAVAEATGRSRRTIRAGRAGHWLISSHHPRWPRGSARRRLRCRRGPGCRAATAPSGGRGTATSDGE